MRTVVSVQGNSSRHGGQETVACYTLTNIAICSSLPLGRLSWIGCVEMINYLPPCSDREGQFPSMVC